MEVGEKARFKVRVFLGESVDLVEECGERFVVVVIMFFCMFVVCFCSSYERFFLFSFLFFLIGSLVKLLVLEKKMLRWQQNREEHNVTFLFSQKKRVFIIFSCIIVVKRFALLVFRFLFLVFRFSFLVLFF